jgi:hypothetical protein
MFNDIINNILNKEPFKTDLKDYILITIDNLDNIQKGSHIKYITLNEELKVAGTLLEIIKKDIRNIYLLIMGSKPWKLSLKTNFIFYKEKNNKISFRKYMKMIANNQINIKIVKKINL